MVQIMKNSPLDAKPFGTHRLKMLGAKLRIYSLHISLILSVLGCTTVQSFATCPTSIAKLAGTYTGAGTLYDYNTSLALSAITTVTASLTVTSTGAGTMTMYAKTGLDQAVTSFTLTGVVRNFNPTTCIAEYYIASSSSSTTKVAISNSGTVITYSDYTASSGQTRIYAVRLEKI